MGENHNGQVGEVRMKPEAFVADWKRKEVSDIQNFIEGSDVVGLVDVSGIGAKQMLAMR